MISSSALHVGRHGSTHSLQQIQLSAARNLQQASSPDSPQISPRRHHDTITEGEESAVDIQKTDNSIHIHETQHNYCTTANS